MVQQVENHRAQQLQSNIRVHKSNKLKAFVCKCIVMWLCASVVVKQIRVSFHYSCCSCFYQLTKVNRLWFSIKLFSIQLFRLLSAPKASTETTDLCHSTERIGTVRGMSCSAFWWRKKNGKLFKRFVVALHTPPTAAKAQMAKWKVIQLTAECTVRATEREKHIKKLFARCISICFSRRLRLKKRKSNFSFNYSQQVNEAAVSQPRLHFSLQSIRHPKFQSHRRRPTKLNDSR